MSFVNIKLWFLALKSINKSSVVLTSTEKRYFNDLKSFTIHYIVKMSCLITSHLMKFNENQVYKQNEVSHWLFPITMIVTIDFRLFSESKSKKIQNVLFDNCCSRNYRMLQQHQLKTHTVSRIISDISYYLAQQKPPNYQNC